MTDTRRLTPGDFKPLKRSLWACCKFAIADYLTRRRRAKRRKASGPATLVFTADTMASYSAKEIRDLLKGHTTYEVRNGER
jgi:hypothetical protein